MERLFRVFQLIQNIKDAYVRQIGSYLREKLVLPAQTSIDRKVFKKVFQQYAGKNLRVFEWGTGISTIYYSRYLVSIGTDFEWHSIDNSREWKEKVAQLVERYGLSKRVHLHLSEFPAFWELPGWSWEEREIPREVCSPEATEYVEYPRQVAVSKGFDVVIVDGRFRRRCLLVASEVLSPGGLVLLHDAQKDHYQPSLGNYKFGRFFNSGNLPGSKIKIKTWIGTLDDNRLPDIKSNGR